MVVAYALKEYNPDIKVFGAEPVEGHAIQGLKNMNEAIVPEIWDPKLLDGIDTVVTLLPDRGDRYISTNLFRSVCAECPP
jgi:cysteine synthase B